MSLNLDLAKLWIRKIISLADICLPNGSVLVDFRLNIADGINLCETIYLKLSASNNADAIRFAADKN